MLVGVPKEIKDNEFRAGMTPAAVAELVHHGHEVIVETSAGIGSGRRMITSEADSRQCSNAKRFQEWPNARGFA